MFWQFLLVAQFHFITFDDSMGFFSDDFFEIYQNYNILKHKVIPLNEVKTHFALCRELYNKNIGRLQKPKKKTIIPKIFHQIWIGPHEPPPVFKNSQESIKKLHPDWQYKLWTDKDIVRLNLKNKKFYDESMNYGEKADIARYEILYRYGGVYADVDYVCIKPFDALTHSYEFFAGIQPVCSMAILTNCVIGSTSGHPVLYDCIESIKNNWHTFDSTIESPNERILFKTGPILFHNSFFKIITLDSEKCIALPPSFLCPGEMNVLRKLDLEEFSTVTKPESFGIHFYTSVWCVRFTRKVKKDEVCWYRKMPTKIGKSFYKNA